MNSSNSIDDSSNEHCKYDIECKKAIMNHCQGCGQVFCMDHYLEHQKKLQENFKYVMYTLDLVKQKWKSLASEIPTDVVLDLINQIYEYSLKSDEVEKTAITIQQQLQDLINEDKQDLKKKSITMTNGSNFDQNDYLENDIERLKQDIEELQLKLKEISNDNQKRVSEEQLHIVDNQSETIKSPPLNNDSRKEKYPVRLVPNNSRKNMTKKSNDTPTLSHLLIRRSSSSNSDSKQNEDVLVKTENEIHPEEEKEQEDDEEQMTVFLDSNTELHINHKVRLSNNIVRWLRGPFKAIIHGTMHAADVCAQGTHISQTVLQAVKKRVAEQNQISMEQQTNNNCIPPTFTEITSDWKLEGDNPDQGYSSLSTWIRDPQGRRVLIKIQQLPVCAANEWLAYVLGRALDLPVNVVQIAIYENNLATSHADVQDEDEKTITFMDLPKKKRKALITNPIMESMDIFDHIIQNVDRNQQNILITIPKTADINDDDDDEMKVKVHLIDHSSSFGMGKVSGISTIASKFHSNHLAVVKFDPIQKSKQFERYLNELPVEDRPVISKTLNRFASITNDQFDSWITEIQDLLSSSQYNRIYCVLRRQRDIAKRCTTQWGISPRSSSIKSNETQEDAPKDK
jgi:hypothetical protein